MTATAPNREILPIKQPSATALSSMPPPTFDGLLRASNPGLPDVRITSKVVQEAYLWVVASRILEHPSAILGIQYERQSSA